MCPHCTPRRPGLPATSAESQIAFHNQLTALIDLLAESIQTQIDPTFSSSRSSGKPLFPTVYDMTAALDLNEECQAMQHDADFKKKWEWIKEDVVADWDGFVRDKGSLESKRDEVKFCFVHYLEFDGYD